MFGHWFLSDAQSVLRGFPIWENCDLQIDKLSNNLSSLINLINFDHQLVLPDDLIAAIHGKLSVIHSRWSFNLKRFQCRNGFILNLMSMWVRDKQYDTFKSDAQSKMK